MTLHVPAQAINDYKKTAPWSTFGIIKTIEGVEIPKCTAPQISYSNGKITINCETDSAEFITEITSSDIDKFYNNIIDLTATYNITVYAIANGYENSETVNATLCWVECECDGSDDTGVINIPATAALVTSNGACCPSAASSMAREQLFIQLMAYSLMSVPQIMERQQQRSVFQKALWLL